MSILVGGNGVQNISGVVTIAKNARISVSGHGFAPGTKVTVWVYSTGIKIGTTLVTKQGTFSLVAPLPKAIAIGRHTIVARGVNKEHVAISVALGVRVIASPAVTHAHPGNSNTGGYVAGAIAITLIIIFGILFAARRRRDDEEIPITT
jgi:hypothetical protein